MRRINGAEPLEMWLWHGTGTLDPARIYEDTQDGFMVQRATGRNLWGRGNYFAEKAAYSNADKYAFQVHVEGMPAGEGYRELLLAKVLVGEAADFGKRVDREIVCPPPREGSHGLQSHSLAGRCSL